MRFVLRPWLWVGTLAVLVTNHACGGSDSSTPASGTGGHDAGKDVSTDSNGGAIDGTAPDASPDHGPSDAAACGEWNKASGFPTSAELDAVSGSAPDDVWVVGGLNTYGTSSTIGHFDGSSWSQPTCPTKAHLRGTWASGTNDAWAVGDSGTIVHWDGSSWTVSASGTTTDLEGVWGSSSGDVWAVGYTGTILHFNGSSWLSTTSNTTATLYGVWGSSSNDVWAVGHATGAGSIVHFDGSSWSVVDPGTSFVPNFNTVSGTGPNDVWAGAQAGTLEHWDGASWSLADTTVPNYALGFSSLSAAGPNDLYAVGGGLIAHWDSSSWSVLQATNMPLQGVWANGPCDAWVVGNGGQVFHLGGT